MSTSGRMPPAEQASDDAVNAIVAEIQQHFRTFGGGRGSGDNPISHALKNSPAQFALGVNVADVVRFTAAALLRRRDVRAEHGDTPPAAVPVAAVEQRFHDADWLDNRADGDSELTVEDREQLRAAASVLRMLADQARVCVFHGPMSKASPWNCGECVAEQMRDLASRLRAVEAEREADKARLDWLTAQSSVVMAAEDGSRDCVLRYLPVDPADNRPAWIESHGDGWADSRGANPREAIDRARAAASPASEPQHVCGVRGFDQMQGDTCPACSRAASPAREE